MELDNEFEQIYPIFSSGPHGYPSPTSQAMPTSTCPYSYPMTKVVEMIPGATAQSAGGREPQRPVDTAARHCVGAGGMEQACLKCFSHTLRVAEATTRGPINHPKNPGVPLFSQQKFNVKKQTGSIKWATRV